MTLKYDGTNLEEVRKLKFAGKITAVVWTHGHHKVVKTKKEAKAEMDAWREHYKAQGWTVQTKGDSYWASRDDERHAIVLHQYDAETLERLN